jgi:hypothetical protein
MFFAIEYPQILFWQDGEGGVCEIFLVKGGTDE